MLYMHIGLISLLNMFDKGWWNIRYLLIKDSSHLFWIIFFSTQFLQKSCTDFGAVLFWGFFYACIFLYLLNHIYIYISMVIYQISVSYIGICIAHSCECYSFGQSSTSQYHTHMFDSCIISGVCVFYMLYLMYVYPIFIEYMNIGCRSYMHSRD